MTNNKKEEAPDKGTSLTPKIAQRVEKVNIDHWLATRDEFIQKVSSKMVEGKDYHIIQDRKSLAKGGAEKIASIFKWVAEFVKDTETLEMLGNPKGVLAYICNLKNGEFVGQGRGARDVSKDKGDINKSIKMAQKSAYIDAVLRSSGLSDIFTQDLEEMSKEDLTHNAMSYPATDRQLKFIKHLMEQKGVEQLGELGFVKPKSMTSDFAREVIETLLQMKPVNKEEVLSEKHLREI